MQTSEQNLQVLESSRNTIKSDQMTPPAAVHSDGGSSTQSFY